MTRIYQVGEKDVYESRNLLGVKDNRYVDTHM